MSLDIKKFAEGVQDYIARAVRPLAERLDALESREPEKGEKGDAGEQGPAGERGADGKDGAGVSEVLEAVSAKIELEVEKALVGLERRAQEIIDRAVDRIPTPKDGRDALDIDELFAERGDSPRIMRVGLRRGDDEVVRELKFPGLLYHGVWEKRSYEQGDCVTWGGSLWICHTDTESKPGTDDTWQLAAKKGRDGKDKA